MSARIATAVLELVADAKSFNQTLTEAEKKSEAIEKQFDKIGDAGKKAGTALSVAGAAIVGSMLAVTKVAADYGDEINKAHVQTGLSTESLSRLKFVADQTESSFDGLSTGLKFLAKNAVEAANSSKGPAAAAFKSLGVSVRDASGEVRPMNDLFLDLADKFSKMEDGPEKAALAMKVFGKSGMDMIPVLNLGRSGILAMGDQAEKLGLVLSGPAAKAGDDFNDSIAGVGAATLGLSNAIGQSLMPSLTEVAMSLTQNIAGVTAFAKEHETLTKVIFGLGLAIGGAGGVLLAIAGVAAAIGPVSAGIILMTGATTASAGAMTILGGVLTALPFVILAAEIAYCVKVIVDMNSATAEAAAANQRADEGLVKNIETLKKLGIEYDATGKSVSQQEQEVAKLTREYWQNHTPAVSDAGKAHKQTAEEVAASEAALKKHQAAIDANVKAVMGDKDATNDLIAAVHALQEKHVSNEVIAEKLGSRFVEIFNTLKSTGQEIPEEVRQFAALSTVLKALHDQGQLSLVPADFKQINADYEREMAAIQQHRLDGIRGIKEAQAQADFSTIQGLAGMKFEAVETFETWLGAVNAVNASQRQATTISAELMADVTGLTKEQVESIRKQAGEAEKATKAHEEAAERFQDAWSAAMGNVTAGIAKGFADMIFEGGNFKETMIGLAKESASGMFSAFLTGLLSPLTSLLGQLGSSLAGSLTGLIGGGGGTGGAVGNAALNTALSSFGGTAGVTGLLSGIVGPGTLLGTFGGTTASTLTSAGFVPGVTTAPSGLLGGVHALFTNPWTAVIGGGILATVAWIKSQAHHEANTFVQNFQNPFHAKLAGIVDEFNAQFAQGHLDLPSATGAWDLTHALWADFLRQGDAFAEGGDDEAQVWGNAKNKLGPIMIQIFGDMEAKLNLLRAAAAAAPAVGTTPGTTPTTTPGTTPTSPTAPTTAGSGPPYVPPEAPVTTIGTPVTNPPPTTVVGAPVIMTPFGPIPAYASGVDWVPRDTMAYIHAGEAVIPRDQNQQRLSSGGGLDQTVNIILRVGEREFWRSGARTMRELIRDEGINFGGA